MWSQIWQVHQGKCWCGDIGSGCWRKTEDFYQLDHICPPLLHKLIGTEDLYHLDHAMSRLNFTNLCAELQQSMVLDSAQPSNARLEESVQSREKRRLETNNCVAFVHDQKSNWGPESEHKANLEARIFHLSHAQWVLRVMHGP